MRIEASKGNPITVYFLRHGQCEGQGDPASVNPPLTPLGLKQAEKTAEYLSDIEFDHVYCSTHTRAIQTAAPIAAALDGTPYTETKELIEVSQDHFLKELGELDLATINEMEREHDVMTRFINRLRHEHDDGGKVLVVAHGNIILSLLAFIGGKDPRESALIAIDNASVTIVQYWSSSGRAVIKKANSTGHLAEEEITA